ncbi:unnamed protein product, partial [Ectocarpus sp. 12 AP-2014]
RQAIIGVRGGLEWTGQLGVVLDSAWSHGRLDGANAVLRGQRPGRARVGPCLWASRFRGNIKLHLAGDTGNSRRATPANLRTAVGVGTSSCGACNVVDMVIVF